RDHQTAVLAKDPVLQVAGQLDRLLACVLLERGAVLDHLRRVRPGGQVAHFDRQIAEDFQNFFALLRITRPDHEQRGHDGLLERSTTWRALENPHPTVYYGSYAAPA